jgi:hypothetical protein
MATLAIQLLAGSHYGRAAAARRCGERSDGRLGMPREGQPSGRDSILGECPARRPGPLHPVSSQTARPCRVPQRSIGGLLRDLLPHVTEVRHDTGELFDLAAGALAGGAARANVRRIAAEMLRLGLMDDERLRRMADETPDGA